MKKIIITILIGLLLVIPSSAMVVDVYYSDTCPYCKSYLTFIQGIQDNFNVVWNFYNVNQVDTGYNVVPTTKIITPDSRIITFEGNDQQRLFCELQEMSTQNCVTYRADTSIAGSWFVNG